MSTRIVFKPEPGTAKHREQLLTELAIAEAEPSCYFMETSFYIKWEVSAVCLWRPTWFLRDSTQTQDFERFAGCKASVMTWTVSALGLFKVKHLRERCTPGPHIPNILLIYISLDLSFFCFVFQTISTGLYLKRFRFLNYFSTLLLAYIHTAVYNPGVYDFNLYMHDPEWIILISKLLFFYTVASNPAAQTFTSNIKLLMQLQRLLHSARIKTKLCFSNFMTVGSFLCLLKLSVHSTSLAGIEALF